ncbi:MAG: radical SAM protein, partial [Isosphaeraceae bacterium]
MADIVIINPRFEPSYWGMDHALPFIGKAANLPVACLPLLAALTPREHSVTLMDENVEPIDWERCARADIVGVTGLSVQRSRMKEILTKLKQRERFTVVGGAWVTVEEDYFEGLADVVFIGEAEETWPQFLREWSEGLHQYRYEQAHKSDMTKVPTPRFDLLKMNRYAFGSLQFSRGCPFQCEFCDIIVTFGRRPRIKTSAQVIAELEAIRKTGLRTVFIVDDNLIGNKKAIKGVLRDVIAWQKRKGYPLTLFTEASIDLADDPELLDLMVEANFIATFIGIESPSEEALRETKKYQNVRQGGTLLEKVHRIQDAGMEVWCGMIMGFDSDDSGIFDRQIEF